MEQLVLLIIIGLISLVNWLMQRSAKLREQRKLERSGRGEEGQTMEVPEFSDETELREDDPEESMRKLMEALGVPQEETKPPPPLPTLVEKKQIPVQDEKRPTMREPSFTAPVAPVSSKTRKELERCLAAVVEKREPSRFRQLISSQEGLRDAIVLSEILGPPQSLKK